MDNENEARSSDEMASLEAARACYIRIKSGIHDDPEEGFKFVQAKLRDARYEGEYYQLDITLPRNSEEAKKIIDDTVIPQCYTRYAARLHLDLKEVEPALSRQEIMDERKKILHFCKRSGKFKDDLTYEEVAPTLEKIAEDLLDLTNKIVSPVDLERIEGDWKEYVAKKTPAIFPNQKDGMLQLSSVIPAETVSLKIAFNLPESEIVEAFDTLRQRFKSICSDEGIVGGTITTRIGRDGHKHEVIATVGSQYRDKISDLIEVINDDKEKIGGIVQGQKDTYTFRTSVSINPNTARDTLRILSARLTELCEEKEVQDYSIMLEKQPDGRNVISVTAARGDKEKLSDVMATFTGDILKGRGGIAGRG